MMEKPENPVQLLPLMKVTGALWVLIILITGLSTYSCASTGSPTTGSARVAPIPGATTSTVVPGSITTEAPTGPLSLEQALDAARKHAPQVRIATADSRVASAELAEANSRRLPKLGASFAAGFMANPPAGLVVPAGALGQLPAALGGIALPASEVIFVPDPEATFYKGTVDLTFPLFAWGKISLAIEAAELGLRAVALDRERSLRGALDGVRTAYLAAVLARESAALLAQAEKTASERLVSAKKRLSLGEGVESSVLEAESLLANLSSRRTSAEEAALSALASLEYLSSWKGSVTDLTSGFSTSFDAAVADDLYARARTGGVSAAALERDAYALRAAQAETASRIEAASGNLRPDLGLSVKVEATGQKVPPQDGWDTSWDWNVTVAVGADASLFDGFAAAARAAKSRAQAEKALAGGEASAGAKELESRRALQDFKSAVADLAAKKAGGNLADKRSAEAAAALAEGSASEDDQSLAGLGVISARLEELLARYNAESALARLRTLAGQ